VSVSSELSFIFPHSQWRSEAWELLVGFSSLSSPPVGGCEVGWEPRLKLLGEVGISVSSKTGATYSHGRWRGGQAWELLVDSQAPEGSPPVEGWGKWAGELEQGLG
jgi:hypothetical protein